MNGGKMDISNLPQEHQDLLDSLKKAIIEINQETAKKIAEDIVDKAIDPNLAIKYAIADGAVLVGQKFDSGEYFLPHLVMAGDLMDEVGSILEKNIPKEQIAKKRIVVIGSVQGDMHSVGKNLVSTMLRSGGFEVHDMGVDVTSMGFIDKAKELKADMIALSSLLTTTMPYQKEVIEDLKSMGIREQFKVMVGGGPVTRDYAQDIGADGYGKDAIEALDEAKKLFS
jgi:corrinoid protein of di/trimethylamine methyltransferase